MLVVLVALLLYLRKRRNPRVATRPASAVKRQEYSHASNAFVDAASTSYSVPKSAAQAKMYQEHELEYFMADNPVYQSDARPTEFMTENPAYEAPDDGAPQPPAVSSYDKLRTASAGQRARVNQAMPAAARQPDYAAPELLLVGAGDGAAQGSSQTASADPTAQYLSIEQHDTGAPIMYSMVNRPRRADKPGLAMGEETNL